MELQFNCQHCNELIISKFLKAGEIAECKKCGEKNTIPENAKGISDAEIKSEHTISDAFDVDSNKQTNSKTIEVSTHKGNSTQFQPVTIEDIKTFDNECDNCSDITNQLDCMSIEGCMWMGDHCMESNDGCMDFDNEFDCMNNGGCYWMGNHCMTGSNCTDPIAFNYNPIAASLGQSDNSTCQYSSFIVFGCTYESALNYNPEANVDDNSCEYSFGDINHDGILDILDLVSIVNIILGN